MWVSKVTSSKLRKRNMDREKEQTNIGDSLDAKTSGAPEGLDAEVRNDNQVTNRLIDTEVNAAPSWVEAIREAGGAPKDQAPSEQEGYTLKLNLETIEAIIEILDDRTFVSTDGRIVGATPADVQQELPEYGLTLLDVELYLESLEVLGIIGSNRSECDGRDSRFYFRVCENGVPGVLHSAACPACIN